LPQTNRLQTEQEHHKHAFELYNSLGAKRSHKTVARQLGVSTSAVKQWSAAFNWSQRVQEKDAASARGLADRALRSDLDDRSKQQKIVQMALIKLAKAIAEGQVKMQLGDLDRLIRLKAYLEGYDESRDMGKTPEEIAEFLNMLDYQTYEKVCAIINARRGETS
jgi:predicted transcriptional regulator